MLKITAPRNLLLSPKAIEMVSSVNAVLGFLLKRVNRPCKIAGNSGSVIEILFLFTDEWSAESVVRTSSISFASKKCHVH